MTGVRWLRSTGSDAALALVFVVAGLVQHAFVPIAAPLVGVVYVLGSLLPLAWRRTFPIPSAFVASCFWLIPLDGFPILGFVAVILQFYSVGVRGRPLLAAFGVTVWAVIVSVIGTLLGPEQPVAAVGAALVVVAPTAAGLVVRHQQWQNARLRALTAQLRAERRHAEQAAVEAERSRIARELHDVVGHEVTLISIQAEAATVALRMCPERAEEPLETIRTTAHRTLAQMRQVLEVLAPAADDNDDRDRDVAAIARTADVAGIPNTLTITGSPAAQSSPVSLAVRRIVRECLTNAGRHAPGQHVDLAIDWTPHRVEIRSANPTVSDKDSASGAAGGSGRGLTGMRHRAELLGGTFDADELGGQFTVRAAIPRDAQSDR